MPILPFPPEMDDPMHDFWGASLDQRVETMSSFGVGQMDLWRQWQEYGQAPRCLWEAPTWPMPSPDKVFRLYPRDHPASKLTDELTGGIITLLYAEKAEREALS